MIWYSNSSMLLDFQWFWPYTKLHKMIDLSWRPWGTETEQTFLQNELTNEGWLPSVPVWQVNVASVVKDNAQFVHALTRVPDPKMQIWHYRLLTGAEGREMMWLERGHEWRWRPAKKKRSKWNKLWNLEEHTLEELEELCTHTQLNKSIVQKSTS